VTHSTSETSATPTLRPLSPDDFQAVVALDKRLSGGDRSGFFEKRLKAATDSPKDYVYVALCDEGVLKGFAMAGLIIGEFGSTDSSALLDAFGVDPDYQHHGAGHALLRELRAVLAHKGVAELQSQIAFDDRALLGFLGEVGFRLAPSVILNRTTEKLATALKDHGENEADEVDHSYAQAAPGTSLEHDEIIVRSMTPEDIPTITRIDKKLVGTARETYFQRKHQQLLAQSGVQASLVAELDGLTVGFIMARVDFGAFGRALPEAVMDTFGVDPGFQGQGVGHTLMSRLIDNLSVLRVENLRTEIAWNNTGLIAFFDSVGFAPAQRIKLAARV